MQLEAEKHERVNPLPSMQHMTRIVVHVFTMVSRSHFFYTYQNHVSHLAPSLSLSLSQTKL